MASKALEFRKQAEAIPTNLKAWSKHFAKACGKQDLSKEKIFLSPSAGQKVDMTDCLRSRRNSLGCGLPSSLQRAALHLHSPPRHQPPPFQSSSRRSATPSVLA